MTNKPKSGTRLIRNNRCFRSPIVLSMRSGHAMFGNTLVHLASTVHKRRAETTNDKRGESDMKIAVPRERMSGETRVATSPDVVKKLVGLGLDVVIEKGAGEAAAIDRRGVSGRGRRHRR